jgi:hypothetical protein
MNRQIRRPVDAGLEVELDRHLNKCLSMVIHHEEVEQMVEVLKRVLLHQNVPEPATGVKHAE